MSKRIFIEASGSLVCNWLIKKLKENGDVVIASDIIEESVGKFLADDFVVVLKSDEKNFWTIQEKILIEHHIDTIIPSLDETLHVWAAKKEYLYNTHNINVIISPLYTIDTCLDKYKTYLFFKENHIPSPATSLSQEYTLIKPRRGRGGKNIIHNTSHNIIDMEGMISQEFLSGQEYTIDCLTDHHGKLIYIVPRRRITVKDGKSINGEVVHNPEIDRYVCKICNSMPFFGPINIQCFETNQGIQFTEINPRIGGGMVLSMQATENWFSLIQNYFLMKQDYTTPKNIHYGLRMYRYYEEIFV